MVGGVKDKITSLFKTNTTEDYSKSTRVNNVNTTEDYSKSTRVNNVHEGGKKSWKAKIKRQPENRAAIKDIKNLSEQQKEDETKPYLKDINNLKKSDTW